MSDDWRQPHKVGAGDAPASKPRRVWRGASDKPASALNSREVIVRVTGRTRSPAALGAQLSYLTRRGDLPGLHSTGRVLHGQDDMRALRDRWVADNAAYARHPSCPTQSLAVVLSMPAGTPLETVIASVHAWAEKHVAPSTEYFIAPHADRAHPHAHVALRAVQRDGYRVRASRADVQAWRETFADSLRERGITAEATPQREKLERLRLEHPALDRRERGVPAREMRLAP